MEITNHLEEEIMRFMDNYWSTYFEGDLETWSTFLADDYKNIGGTAEEIWNSKKEIMDYTIRVMDQMKGTAQLRNKQTQVFSLEPFVLAHEFVDIYIKTGDEWAFYGKFRLSTILQKTVDSWQVLHQHGSYPDSKTEDGEAFAFDKISTENRELKEAIKRRTIELESKNRELQIEASLEKVRAVAMSMQTPDDILDICKSIFTELQLLGFSELRNSLINFWDDDNDALIDYDYSDEAGANKAQIRYNSHPVFEKFQEKIRQSKDSFAELVVNEGLLESWKQRRRESGEYDDPRLEGISALYYYFYSIGVGAVGISTFSSLNTEKLNILKRFRNVFELAYRRYMDVAQAETQAKEAMIELGLERVRARAMAMHNSAELAELVSVVFTELTNLGFTLTSCIIWIHDPVNSRNTLWIASAEMNKPAEPFFIQPFHTEFFKSVIHAWKVKDPKWVFYLAGEEKENFEKAFFNELPNLPDALKNALTTPKQVVFSASFNHFGALEIVETEALTDEKFGILHRFGKVFDASFTRFNDLKKAEAQAKEAQIELGLERVRARAMAMQTSGELKELIGTVFTELTKLDLVLTRCLIMIFDPNTNGSTWWMANSEDASNPMGLFVKYHELPPYLAYIKAWKQQTYKWQYILEGTDKKGWDDFIFVETELSNLPGFVIAGMKAPDRVYLSASFNNFGCLNLASLEPLSGDHIDILLRFANVFDLTYTRFNDLQKAEAQVRESQIQLAMERVRARTMAMHKSDELQNVIQVVYEQFVHLNILVEHAGFILDYKTRDDMHIWLADKHTLPFQVAIPYFDCAHWNSFIEAKENQLDFFSNHLSFEEKNKFYQDLFQLIPGVPEESLQYYLSCPGLAISTVLLDNIGLYIENFSGIPYTAEENNILIRLGKVFQQTYTRFLDLQKAEAQAKEAQVETALERVRSRSMAMHKSEELADLSLELVKQVQALGVATWFCAFNIYDDDPQGSLEWGSNGQGTFPRYRTPREGIFLRYFEAGQRGEILLINEIGKNECAAHYEYLCSLPGVGDQLLEMKAAGIPFPTFQIDHVAFFKYGYIIFITYEPVTEAHDIFKRFAKVFEQTYTRFLDLQKAEAQAKEAKIEAALERTRTQSMIMQHSNELDDTLRVFHEQVLLLGIPSAFSFLWLPDEKNDRHIFWAAWGEDKNGTTVFKSKAINYPLDRHEPATAQCLVDWKSKRTVYSYHVPPAAVDNYLNVWHELIYGVEHLKPQFFIDGLYYVEAFMKYGCFGVMVSTDLNENEKKLLHRFAVEFERTYTRFLDLQKAEAQAREALIEAGLERVRSRSLAMHNTSELQEVIHTVHKELIHLDIAVSGGSFIAINSEIKNELRCWGSGGTADTSEEVNIPLYENPFCTNLINGIKNGPGFFTEEFTQAEKKEFFTFLFKHEPWSRLDAKQKNQTLYSQGGYTRSCSVSKHTSIFIVNHFGVKFSEAENIILRRFGKAFEQTYTRFLDLQKAEAQTREAQINLAVERVRAKALAMFKSEEILDVVFKLKEEIMGLNIPNVLAATIHLKEADGRCRIWDITSLEMAHGQIHQPLDIKYRLEDTDPNFFMRRIWDNASGYFIVKQDEEDFKRTIQWLRECDSLQQADDTEQFLASTKIKELFHPTVQLESGRMCIDLLDIPTAEVESILIKMGGAFDLAYKRFEDLQKAEAQVRESEIELALERVRARTMAMQKSEELREVIQVIHNQLVLLGFEISNSGIMLDYKQNDDFNIWMADSYEEFPVQVQIPYIDHPQFNSYKEAKNNSLNFYSTTLTFEEKNKWFQHVFKNISGITEETKEAVYSSPGMATSGVLLNNTAIYLLNYTGTPYSDAQNDTLMRFGKVFEQTYTRFNDLQQAEAQAREAQIELGLERVRARAMAMQKSGELSELVDTVFKELTKLDFALSWCMINIIDESSMSNTVWGANPEIGKAPESYHMLFEDYRFHHEMFKAWKEKQSKWTIVLKGREKEIYDEYLFNKTEFRRVPEHVQKQMRASAKYEGSFTFSNFGGLQTIGEEPLSEANMDILARFGKVFDLTYTRFNDLKLAEAQAMEAQIEAALERVRSRSMAMHNSDELLEAGEIIFVEMQKLGIESLTAGYVLMDKEEKNGLNYTPHPGTKKIMPVPVIIPHNETIHMQQVVENWKKGNPFFIVEMDEEATIKHQTFIAERSTNFPLSAAELIAISPAKLFLHNFYFKDGYILIVGGRKLSVEQTDIMLRFATVFQQTYTRFLDLQKAEAQAREAKIEAALEKVRSRTMAMQNSDELPDAANVLFLEVQKLGIPAWSCGYNVLAKDKRSAICWMSSEGALQEPFTLRLFGEASFDEMGHFLCSEKTMLIQELADKAIDDHYNYMKSFPDLKATFDHIEANGLSLPTFQVNHLCKYTHGFLLFITYEQVPDAHDIFKRFTKVFEQTYTRFLDLQKAEAQTREAKIEMALEKVRARTMGMQKSGELADVAKVLFTELNSLVHNLWTCGFVLCEKERNEDEWWLSMDDGFTRGFFLPNVDDFAHATLYEGWLRGEAFREVQLDGNELQAHYDWLMKVPVARAIFEEMDAAGLARPEWQKLHAAYFSKGYLVIITREPSPGEEIFKRFAQVFDLTYTRFLDLQKAEAQARESQIQLALERVRARTMAMQRSDELADAATILFQQVKALGVSQWACGFNIWEIGDEEYTYYPGDPDGQVLAPCKVPLTGHWVFSKMDESRKRGEEFYMYEKEGKEQEEHYRYMLSVPGGLGTLLQNMLDAGMQIPSFQIDHFANFSHGNLMFITYEHFPEMHDIFKRFAKVFEQTYTRFLDLQKAEAQAREAQIEAALERVRSRTMAMQKSNELQEAALLLVQQVKTLGVPSFACGYNIWDENRTTATAWMAGEDRLQPPFKTSSSEDVFFYIHEAAQRGEQLFIAEQEGEELETHYRYMATIPEFRDIIEKMAKAGLSVPTFQIIHCAFFSQGYLMFISFEPVPEAHDIFKRFAKVFEQTYTRFLDLQKAEAQAMEAIKRASVDRVRAEIASMRTTVDLERIQPLIWNELKILGVPFIRCGVFIMDDGQQEVNTLLSTPDGKAIAAFRQSYNAPGEITAIVDSWHKKEIYKQHWDEDQFLSFAKNLVEQGAVTSGEKYLTENRPTDLYLHFLPFLQGMLYVGNTSALSDDELHLVQNLGDAFSTAYARYEDFNKLEAAKQQVDNTLNELQVTQKQLIQSEKMASLGELTAGIAHEIQNPLNFVNNFSDVSKELLDEMREALEKGDTDEAKEIMNDVIQNLEKINHHGKRADGIVKGMLQHSRSSSGQKEPTNINVLADEYLRLAYHGLRAKDKSFNATLKTDYDESIGSIDIIPQDIGRVILNLITNAFYAVAEKKKNNPQDYEPTVTINTKLLKPPLGGLGVLISVADNGGGIPKKVMDKIFQPFFTTKPTGQGTGLGLSLSYDIVKAHGGELKVETKEGKGSEFIIQLPGK